MSACGPLKHSAERPGSLKLWLAPALAAAVFLTAGCSLFIASATRNLTANLTRAIVNNNDPETVAAGAPAYLLMIDGLLAENPNDPGLLQAAAGIYTAYTDVFVKDLERARKLTAKGRGYALQAVCARRRAGCGLDRQNFQEFETSVAAMTRADVPALFALGSAWAAWIQVRKNDWNAVADLARVQAIMQRVVELDEPFRDGAAHLYLGVLATFIPPALGGQPEKGRRHFERALELCGGRNLMINVMYARYYARMIFDRELHDRLLNAVLAAEPAAEGYTLGNTLARQQAAELLNSAEDFF